MQKEKRKHQIGLNNINNYLDSMNRIKEIPLSTVIEIPFSVAILLITKMIKTSKVIVTIPYINPHTNIQDKLELKIKSDNNDKSN